LAAPSPIDDEEFLLFLAESIEKDGEMIDPLSMIETVDDEDDEQPANEKEAEHE
jgi:hypothetical protein